jgi:hypothetical protein
MNDSRHGTAKRCLVFSIEFRELFFADVLNVFHVLPYVARRPLVSREGSRDAHWSQL